MTIQQSTIRSIACALMLCGVCANAWAHLMVARHGTVNIVNDGAFVVVSVPVSAFIDIDDNSDGHLTAAELRRHEAKIKLQIIDGFQLRTGNGVAPLQGLLVNRVTPHAQPNLPAQQLVFMGRFSLPPAKRTTMRLTVGLFGRNDQQPSLKIKARHGKKTIDLLFTPSQRSSELKIN